MTQLEFDALRTGDLIDRKSTGRRLIVTVTNRGHVWADNLKNGRPFGRGYRVTLEGYEVAPSTNARLVDAHAGREA